MEKESQKSLTAQGNPRNQKTIPSMERISKEISKIPILFVIVRSGYPLTKSRKSQKSQKPKRNPKNSNVHHFS